MDWKPGASASAQLVLAPRTDNIIPSGEQLPEEELNRKRIRETLLTSTPPLCYQSGKCLLNISSAKSSLRCTAQRQPTARRQVFEISSINVLLCIYYSWTPWNLFHKWSQPVPFAVSKYFWRVELKLESTTLYTFKPWTRVSPHQIFFNI